MPLQYIWIIAILALSNQKGSMMLMYFIIFTVIGFVIGTVVKDMEKAIPIIIGIAVLWGLTSAPIWGLATLGELSLGFYIFMMSNQKTNLS